MASVALYAAGSAIGGVGVGGLIGGAIGGTVGSLIDSQLIFPAIFGDGQQDTQGPRLDDLQIQTASEGSPVNYVMGKSRVAGTVIWMPPLIEQKNTEEVGGGKGGGGGGEHTTYSYFASAAIGICEGPISRILKVWADGKLIFNDSPDISLTSSAFDVTERVTYKITYVFPGIGGGGSPIPVKVVDKVFQIMSSPAGGRDLTQFRSGQNATITGFANAGNNGTFRVTRTMTGQDGTTYLEVQNANAVNEPSGESVTITQEVPNFNTGKVASVEYYYGDQSQEPDPLIESHEGVGQVPGFRGLAYVVLERLNLRDFGNRLPQFTFLVESASSVRVSDAVDNLLERAGLEEDQYDVRMIDVNQLRGYVLSGPQATDRALSPLIAAYNLGVRETGGRLSFYSKGAHQRHAISEDDLGAYEEGGEPAEPLTVTDGPSFDLPSEVNVSFLDPTKDYQKASLRERRIDTPTDGVVNADLPLVLTSSEARDIAKRRLWTAWAERESVTLSLPPSFTRVQEGDLLSVTYKGEDRTIRVLEVTRGNNFLHQVRGVIEDSQTSYAATDADESEGAGDDEVVALPPDLTLYAFDLPPLQNQHNQSVGYYRGLCSTDPSVSFPGASVYSSLNNSTFSLSSVVGSEAVIGRAVSVLGDGPTLYWDRKNTVDIELLNGELESRDPLEVLNGANRMYLGGELIGFADAELIDTRTYRLSMLLRGTRNTEEFTATHSEAEEGEWAHGEWAMLLNPTSVEFRELNDTDIQTRRYLKAVSEGGSIDDVDSQEVFINGESVKPFSPTHAKGERDVDDNLTLTWTRRTRMIRRLFGPSGTPMVESSERYEVDIIDPDGNVARTFEVTEPTVTYTAAQQTDDGFTPGNRYTVRIYQIGDLIGRGRVKEFDV